MKALLMTVIVAIGAYGVVRIFSTPPPAVERPAGEPAYVAEGSPWRAPAPSAALAPATPKPPPAATPLQIPPGLIPIAQQIAEALLKSQAARATPLPARETVEAEEPPRTSLAKPSKPGEVAGEKDDIRKFDFSVTQAVADGAVCYGFFYGLKPSETIHPEKLDPRDKNRMDIGIFFVDGLTGVFDGEHRTGWMERVGTRRIGDTGGRSRVVPAFRAVQEPPPPVHKQGDWMRWSGRTMFDPLPKTMR